MNATGMLFAVCAVLLCCLATAVDYSYSNVRVAEQERGPARWGEIVEQGTGRRPYEVCRSGSAQSPVDVTLSDAPAQASHELQPLTTALRRAGGGAPIRRMTVVADGAQSFARQFDAPPEFIDPASLQVLRLQRLMLRSPSDHSFGGGKRDGEMQLLFADSSNTVRASISISLAAGAVSMNNALQSMIVNIPEAPTRLFEAARTASIELNDWPFDVTQLLPPTRSYATYDGSLTFPPCTEGVRHYVMLEAITVSAAQLNLLRQRLGWNETVLTSRAFAGNSRPLQPRRPVRFFLDNAPDLTSFRAQSPHAGSGAGSGTLSVAVAAVTLSLLAMGVAGVAFARMWKLRLSVFVGTPGTVATPDTGAASSVKYLKSQ